MRNVELTVRKNTAVGSIRRCWRCITEIGRLRSIFTFYAFLFFLVRSETVVSSSRFAPLLPRYTSGTFTPAVIWPSAEDGRITVAHSFRSRAPGPTHDVGSVVIETKNKSVIKSKSRTNRAAGYADGMRSEIRR